jgi:hypothetical protein
VIDNFKYEHILRSSEGRRRRRRRRRRSGSGGSRSLEILELGHVGLIAHHDAHGRAEGNVLCALGHENLGHIALFGTRYGANYVDRKQTWKESKRERRAHHRWPQMRRWPCRSRSRPEHLRQ